jgi:hypothetical protein
VKTGPISYIFLINAFRESQTNGKKEATKLTYFKVVSFCLFNDNSVLTSTFLKYVY